MNVDKLVEEYITEIGFKKYPAGWNRTSVRKFAKTISQESGKGPTDKGWFDL